MTSLKDRLQTNLTTAIRGRDELTAATLRMALTAIKSEEVSGSAARELSDDEVVVVLNREARKRREAASAFAEAGRPERARREEAELSVLQAYLPSQLDDDELAALVSAAVDAAAAEGATGLLAMGRVMKSLQPQVAGRADGAKVAAMVRARLQG